MGNNFITIPLGDEEPPQSQMANSESLAIANGRLKKIQRSETRKTLIHRASCTVFVVAVIGAIVMLGSVVYHYVTPPSWRYLTDQQLHDVQNILLAAVASKMVTSAGERWFDTDDD